MLFHLYIIPMYTRNAEGGIDADMYRYLIKE